MVRKKRGPGRPLFATKCPLGLAQDQGLALVYHALGRTEEADAAIARLTAATDIYSIIWLAEIYAHQGNYEASFEKLRSALEAIHAEFPAYTSDGYLMRIRLSPFLRALPRISAGPPGRSMFDPE